MHRENERANPEHRVGRLFVLSGPSGAGKGTLREHALKDIPHLVYSISCTTRRPRPGELDGREYRFISHEQFTKWVNEGRFLEYAHVHDDMYGTLKDDVTRELEAGNDVLLEIDVQGALQVREKIPEALLVFVDVPSMEVLERRLRDRHTESESALRVRLANAEKERAMKSEYNYVIVNDELDTACAELRRVIMS